MEVSPSDFIHKCSQHSHSLSLPLRTLPRGTEQMALCSFYSPESRLALFSKVAVVSILVSDLSWSSFFSTPPLYCCSVAKSCLTLCDPMDCSTPEFPCPSLSLRIFSSSCPLSCWCHPTISFSVARFSFCLQSFPTSGSFRNELALCISWPEYWSFKCNSLMRRSMKINSICQLMLRYFV